MAQGRNILLPEKPIEPLDAYLPAGAALVKGPSCPCWLMSSTIGALAMDFVFTSSYFSGNLSPHYS
jgi:hypothetical protein